MAIPIQYIVSKRSDFFLTTLLRSNRIEEYRSYVTEATQFALVYAVEWTANRGMLEDMKLALDQITYTNTLSIIHHLIHSDPFAIPILLDSNVYEYPITKQTIEKFLSEAQINPECLRQMLRHPKYRYLVNEITPPQEIKSVAGFGFAIFVEKKNSMYETYRDIIEEEKVKKTVV